MPPGKTRPSRIQDIDMTAALPHPRGTAYRRTKGREGPSSFPRCARMKRSAHRSPGLQVALDSSFSCRLSNGSIAPRLDPPRVGRLGWVPPLEDLAAWQALGHRKVMLKRGQRLHGKCTYVGIFSRGCFMFKQRYGTLVVFQRQSGITVVECRAAE